MMRFGQVDGPALTGIYWTLPKREKPKLIATGCWREPEDAAA